MFCFVLFYFILFYLICYSLELSLFFLVWIRGGVNRMDLVYPHPRWNGFMNGTVFSVGSSLILVMLRHIIGIVVRV